MTGSPEASRILVVDDDRGLLLSVRATLLSAGLPDPAMVSDSREVIDMVRNRPPHLVVLDLVMPHVSGMDLLKSIKEEHHDVECVVVTAMDDVGLAVRAMKYGAYDYLVKPIERDRLTTTVGRALERYSLKRGLKLHERDPGFDELKNPDAFSRIVSRDPAMARVFLQAESVAASDYSVVISGESGTGKELLARVIHDMSPRATRPFIPVNMAAFGREIFEDQFFGHVKGAFTGAGAERRGFFEEAHTGTLFLDEITELDPTKTRQDDAVAPF
ncbi:MAG: sigma-54-dependent transcriptional regulator [Desulfatibacillaceae bacterium]